MSQGNIDLLLKKGLITDEQLLKAKDEVNKTGMPIEKALEKLGFISQADIAKVIADSLGVPFMDLDDYLIDPEVTKLVPEALARRFKAVPLFRIGDTLTVAMADPHDIVAVDEITKISRVSAVDTVMSTPQMIQEAIDRYYASLGDVDELIGKLGKGKTDLKDKSDINLSAKSSEPPVIKLVNMLISQAVKDRASDIHIEPEEETLRVRYRIDGLMQEIQVLPKHLQGALISRVKVMSKMDISESRNAQDGRIQLKMEHKALDLRVSSFPTVHGENIVIRILDKSAVLFGLAELGFSTQDLNSFNKLIRRPNGIILVTGPTGSGKTTTLYAALSTINSVDKNIITIEDPVEYEIPMIRQTQVNVKAGLTFANGLRSILRQDPDIIMVGEIRDKETADIAIQASLTGHLVLSTLHTNDAASALTRLIDMGVEPFLISSSVAAILAQRLVRLICPRCKEKYQPSIDLLKDLGLKEPFDFYHGKGCSKCKNTGFLGRIGIYEMLVINNEIKEMVIAKASSAEIKNKAIALKMHTLFDDGLMKVKEGFTTIEEVLRVTQEE
jgi:type IV pilus assembly protein PilB